MHSKCSLEQGSSARYPGLKANGRKKRTEPRMPNPKVPIRHAILEQKGLNGIVRTAYFRMENGVNGMVGVKYSCDEKTQDSSSKYGKHSGSLKIFNDAEEAFLHGTVSSDEGNGSRVSRSGAEPGHKISHD